MNQNCFTCSDLLFHLEQAANSSKETDVRLSLSSPSARSSPHRSDASGYERKTAFEESSDKIFAANRKANCHTAQYINPECMFSRKKQTRLTARDDAGDSAAYCKVCLHVCVCESSQHPSPLSSSHLWRAATSPYRLPHHTCWGEFDTCT